MVIACKETHIYLERYMIRLTINKLQINLQKGRFTETQRGLDHRKRHLLNLL